MQNGHDQSTYGEPTGDQILINAWVTAVSEFYELHRQLMECLENPPQTTFSAGTFYIGQCSTDELRGCLEAMSSGIQQLVDSVQGESSEKGMELLAEHIQLLNDLTRQAQIKLALTKLPPS
ncbi:hypothetical protein [Fibrisoma limi]|nr:hypothetical protein [Fibrisoma limi]